jgi:hypothetical protein
MSNQLISNREHSILCKDSVKANNSRDKIIKSLIDNYSISIKIKQIKLSRQDKTFTNKFNRKKKRIF